MKTAIFLTTLLTAPLTQAAEPAVKELPGNPLVATTTILRWADRCTNLTSSGWAFKGPRNFLQWLEVFSDPGIWLEFGRRGLDPQSYVRSLSTCLDPGTPKNFLEWSDPEIYDKWAKALAEPDFYAAVSAILLDPERIARWTQLPVDPRSWSLLATALHPDTAMKWLGAPWHPDTQALVAKILDPETALNWSRALVDPENYPGLRATRQPTPTGGESNPYLQSGGTPWKRGI